MKLTEQQQAYYKSLCLMGVRHKRAQAMAMAYEDSKEVEQLPGSAAADSSGEGKEGTPEDAPKGKKKAATGKE